MIMLVVKPDYFLDSASRGLLLFATSVLPAIFPFFFCSSLLTAMGAANALSKLGAKPVRVLFNAAPEGAYVLALSMLSGYPIGAATVSDLYRRGVITEAEAKKSVRSPRLRAPYSSSERSARRYSATPYAER